MKGGFTLLLLLSILFGCSRKEKEINIRIPIYTWGGYAPLILAAGNKDGEKKDSLFYKYGKFNVLLEKNENISEHISNFINGTYPIICVSVDMLPLICSQLSNNKNAIPKVFGILDFSYGGDNIIIRGNIKNIMDLKGKRIITIKHSPSHFIMLYLLNQANLYENDVEFIFAENPQSAKEDFISNKAIDALACWSPFTYYIAETKSRFYIKGCQSFVSTADATISGLIARVFIARSDFIKNNPDTITYFMKAYFEACNLIQENKEIAIEALTNFFELTNGTNETIRMLNETKFADIKESIDFFNGNLYRIFMLSSELYKNNRNALPSEFNINPEEIIFTNAILRSLQN